MDATSQPRVTTLLHSVKKYAAAHKVISTIVALIALYGAYHIYSVFTAPSTATRYVTTTVATGTVVASMSETGQVSASSNVDVQSKSSGEVLSLPVAAGQHVGAGTPIAYIDPTAAQQAVRTAAQSLLAAQISLAKLQEPAATSTLTSTQNSVASAQANLVQAHESGYNDISAAFLVLPNMITGLDTVLHGTTVPGRTSEQNAYAYSDMTESYDSSVVQYRTTAENAFQAANVSYTQTLAAFKSTPRASNDATIETLIKQTYNTAALISDALKASTNFLNFVNTTLTSHSLTLPSTLNAHINTLTGYTTTINNNVATLSSDVTTVTSDERALAAAQASLSQLQSGADPLDVQSSQLSLQMKQDALAVAQQSLSDTTIRAPFSGTVAKLNVQQYQTIGNGTSVATMVSDNQSVALSVNEVDAAKLSVGQKATITFDALPNISIAGTVSSVNTIGTVTSGVVSYNAVVTFDTPNAVVKPGMSATASIIIGTETGLSVPSTAVKTASGQKYVLTFSPPLEGSSGSAGAVSPTEPIKSIVTTGLSDNTNVIIESGLVLGAQVVTKTIAGTAVTTATNAAQSTSIFGIGGTTRTGTGAVRATTGKVRTTGP